MKKGQYQGILKGAEANKIKRLSQINNYYKQGKTIFQSISEGNLDLMCHMLYWAEGSKSKNRFGFSNSDPQMILLMKKWLIENENINPEDIMPRLLINQIHELRIHKVLSFWSSLLELPREQFGKPFLVKTINKKVYENHDDYYGVIMLRVRKSSQLQYKMLGVMQAAQEVVSRSSSVG